MRPNRKLSSYVKATARRRRQSCRNIGFAHSLSTKRQLGRARRNDLLARNPEPLRKNRPQALVTSHHVPQRKLQPPPVHRPPQLPRHRHRIGGPLSLQTIQNPQPPLRKRKRYL